MHNKATIMNKEIRAISNYRALLLSKFFISISLFASSYYIGYLGYAASPVYILLLFLLLTPILSFAIKDYSVKYHFKLLRNINNETPFLLNTLKRKYHYSKISYVSNTLSFFFTLILLTLWQINLNRMDSANFLALKLPISIITVGILIRLLGSVFYQFKLPYDLSHNKV